MVDFINEVGSAVRDFTQSATQTIGSEITSIANKGKQLIEDFTTPETVGKQVRTAGSLPVDGKPQTANRATATYSEPPETKDWRVRLSLPASKIYRESPLLYPLTVTDGLVFPYTPTVILQHQVNYDMMHPTHTNYPFYAFNNGEPQPMQITGDFYVQTQDEARYWVGVLHYLRSVTKMSYGQGSNSGQPPPIVRLNGYGDYVFNNVPVLVTNFMVDLPADVDYISTGIEVGEGDNTTSGVAWAPTRSQFTLTVNPTYSRRDVQQFNLDKFVKGDYVLNNKGFL